MDVVKFCLSQVLFTVCVLLLYLKIRKNRVVYFIFWIDTTIIYRIWILFLIISRADIFFHPKSFVAKSYLMSVTQFDQFIASLLNCVIYPKIPFFSGGMDRAHNPLIFFNIPLKLSWLLHVKYKKAIWDKFFSNIRNGFFYHNLIGLCETDAVLV